MSAQQQKKVVMTNIKGYNVRMEGNVKLLDVCAYIAKTMRTVRCNPAPADLTARIVDGKLEVEGLVYIKPIVFQPPKEHLLTERAAKVLEENRARNAKVKHPQIPQHVRDQIAKENERRYQEMLANEASNRVDPLLFLLDKE